jgi:hypothetical protein
MASRRGPIYRAPRGGEGQTVPYIKGLGGIVCQHNQLTLGITGLGVFIIAWLMGRSKQFPRGLSYPYYFLKLYYR